MIKSMRRLLSTVAVSLLMLVPAGLAAAKGDLTYDKTTNVYWDDPNCDKALNGPGMRVNLTAIKNDSGNIRMNLYDDPETFLDSGARIARIDIPARKGELNACLPLPSSGKYALAVLHDEDADGDYDVLKEGYGFPNNPKLYFGPPSFAEAAFQVDGRPIELGIKVRYFYPGQDSEDSNRRRRRRR